MSELTKKELEQRRDKIISLQQLQEEKDCKHTWDTACKNCGFTVQYATRIEQIKKDAREQALSYLPEQLPDRVVPMLEHYITQTAEAATRAERERLSNLILPKVQKFIDKVESGRARSIETYADMKAITQALEDKANSLSKKL